MQNLWIGVAGFAGAVARYQLEGLVSRSARGAFPWGTFVVNISGCFVLGLLVTLLTERFLPHPHLRTAVTVGFDGFVSRDDEGGGTPALPAWPPPSIASGPAVLFAAQPDNSRASSSPGINRIETVNEFGGGTSTGKQRNHRIISPALR